MGKDSGNATNISQGTFSFFLHTHTKKSKRHSPQWHILHWMMSFRCSSRESSMVYRVCLVMLLRSTFLQSSSIWNVMSALWITVRDAWNPTQSTH